MAKRRKNTGQILGIILLILNLFSTVNAGDVVVTWDPNSELDLAGYKVYYGTSSRNYSTILDVGNTTERTITNLTDGVQYYFAVTAYDTALNESGYSGEVNTLVGNVDTTPPADPNLTNHSIQNLKITIQWQSNNESDLAGYKVHYGTQSGNYSDVVDVGLNTSYQSPDLVAGQTYYFAVTAYDSKNNESNYSNEISVQVPVNDTNAPSKPIIAEHRLDGKKIYISWNPNDESDLAGYKVHYGTVSNNYNIIVDVSKATSYTTPDLQNGVTYYLAVTAYDTANNRSPFSDEISYSVNMEDRTAPAVPVVSNFEIEERKVHLYWNNVDDSDLAGYKVYYGTAQRNYDVVEDIEKANEYITPDLDGGTTYYFALTAYDESGNESNFSEEVTAEIPLGDITPPEIYAVEIKDSILVNLVYSEPVEKSSAENKANYAIDHGIEIQNIVLDENERMVHITTSVHEEGILYSLTINNVKDKADNPNIIKANSTCEYRFNPTDHTPPALVDAKTIDATHIDVVFSEDIDRASAETKSNYAIDKGITIIQAKLDDNLRIVHLTTTAHQNSVTYTLTVNNITDRAPEQNSIAANSARSYTFYEEDNTAPGLYSAVIRTSDKVEVVFTEMLDQSTAENIANYSINNDVEIYSAELDNNLQVVHLTTSHHTAGVSYVLTVNNVMDRAYPPNVINSNSTISYTYTPDDNIAPTIVLVNIIDATHVDVTYSEDIERESAENTNNYYIDNGISIVEAELDNNQRVVHLTTSAHEGGVTYQLVINNVKDRSSDPNVIRENSTAAYTYVIEDRNPPEIAEVNMVNETSLEVVFSKIVSRVSAENKNNFYINNGIEIYSAKLYADLKTVILLTSAHDPYKNYILTVNDIKDRANPPNTIVPNSSIHYNMRETTNPGGTIASNINVEGYSTGYLKEGDTYYLDRSYKIVSIPEEYKDLLWIKTANNDRGREEQEFLKFDLSDEATVYICYDSRAQKYPGWLTSQFRRTGKSVRVSEYAEYLEIWEKDCQKGEVVLGGNLAQGALGAESMYIVMINPNSSNRPPKPDDTTDPQSLGPTNVYLLYQNYPNPFNAGTEIRFQLPENCYVTLTIYNILGQTVKRLVEGERQASHYIIHWDGKNSEGNALPSGVYFSRLQVIRKTTLNGKKVNQVMYNDVRKMIYLK